MLFLSEIFPGNFRRKTRENSSDNILSEDMDKAMAEIKRLVATIKDDSMENIGQLASIEEINEEEFFDEIRTTFSCVTGLLELTLFNWNIDEDEILAEDVPLTNFFEKVMISIHKSLRKVLFFGESNLSPREKTINALQIKEVIYLLESFKNRENTDIFRNLHDARNVIADVLEILESRLIDWDYEKHSREITYLGTSAFKLIESIRRTRLQIFFLSDDFVSHEDLLRSGNSINKIVTLLRKQMKRLDEYLGIDEEKFAEAVQGE